MAIDEKLIDQLLAEHGHRPQDIAGENGLLKQLTKALLERAMQAEMTDHLGYEKHDPAGHKSGNSRNGKSVTSSGRKSRGGSKSKTFSVLSPVTTMSAAATSCPLAAPPTWCARARSRCISPRR